MAQIHFQSKENRPGSFCRHKDRLRYSFRSEWQSKNSADVDAGSMLLKLGLCAAACALVFALNINDDSERYTEDDSVETEEAERPGTLKFVEFPGLLSVFSSDEGYTLPIVVYDASFQQDNQLLCLLSKEEQTVHAIEGGIVQESGSHDEGEYIAVKTSDAKIWYYAGLKTLRAEIGQNISANDTIGEISEDSALYVRCEAKGKAVDLQKLFSPDGKI